MKLAICSVAISLAVFMTARDQTTLRRGISAEQLHSVGKHREAFSFVSVPFKAQGNDQKAKGKFPRPLDQWPMECEGAATRLDFAVIETNKLEGAHLIIIARLGDGEHSSRLNQIRLAVIEEYVLRRGSELKYVLAQGSRVKGLGRVELYVGGRLKEIMPYEKNAKSHCIPER